MSRRGPALGLALAALAGGVQAAPRPASLPELVAWAERTLTGIDDWPVLGFNSVGVTFGSPTGATLWDNGLVEGDVRQEYFEPVELGGRILRSTMGRWTVDCARQRYAVLRVTLYARNDLKAEVGEQETEPPVWFARDGFSADAIDAMCDAAGKPPPAVKTK